MAGALGWLLHLWAYCLKKMRDIRHLKFVCVSTVYYREDVCFIIAQFMRLLWLQVCLCVTVLFVHCIVFNICFHVFTQMPVLYTKLCYSNDKDERIHCFNRESKGIDKGMNEIHERKTGRRVNIRDKLFPVECQLSFNRNLSSMCKYQLSGEQLTNFLWDYIADPRTLEKRCSYTSVFGTCLILISAGIYLQRFIVASWSFWVKFWDTPSRYNSAHLSSKHSSMHRLV
jgi:hypothetical protein